MRELKFRAWLPELETMVFSNNQADDDLLEVWNLNDHGFQISVMDIFWRVEGGEPVEHNEYVTAKSEIMQFTGLFDKNKVDIYEGDICTKMISPDENNLAPRELSKGEIVYHIGGFCYYSGGYYYPLSRMHGVVDIMGNIYQNSELLTH